jgi:putative copper export protein
MGGIHNLTAAIWVGGLTTLLFVVLPAFSQSGDAAVLMSLQKRMVKIIRPVIAVLVVTGLLSLRNVIVGGNGEGLSRPYLIILIAKIVITVLMIAVAFRRQWWLYKYAYSRPRRGFILLAVNTVLGWITMLLSGLLDAVGDAAM